MEIVVAVNADFVIPEDCFDCEPAIAARVAAAPLGRRTSLGKALRYLYLSDGPTNLTRDHLKAAQADLSMAEQKVARWLQIRTNGTLRANYGKDALLAARSAKYRCADCGFADVRVLNLDHVDGRIAGTAIRCVCANCHHIKSCQVDWTGSAKKQCK